MKVAINGFGRIGKNIFKIALERKIQIVAINDLHGAEDAAYALKYDSVYGNFKGKVHSSGENLIVNGKKYPVLSEMDPEKLPWKKLGVDVVIEATGAFTKRDGAMKHIKAGAKRVIITAPSDDADITLIIGVNENKLKKTHEIISIASCTTNCLAPVVKVLNEKFGIKESFLTTLHAYTASQNIVDGFHKKRRRGRTAGLNIVPTSTGATDALSRAMPEMKGKMSGLAMRVPIASGSIIDFVAHLKKKTSVNEVNKAFKDAAEKGMKGILDYTEDEIVSSDIIGNTHSSIVDGLSTMMQGEMVKVLAWYDNEHGYSSRVIDSLKLLRG